MNQPIKIFIVTIILLTLFSCDDDSVRYVGDVGQSTTGVVIGTVIDSTSREALAGVEVVAFSVFVDSTNTDTAYTKPDGMFQFDYIYESDYYLSFKKSDYLCRNILVSVEDTLRIKKPIALLKLP